ncbi:MAG: APC family permease [Caldilineales bacterium]|nr:APC family permease [Caldilineales bacterium]
MLKSYVNPIEAAEAKKQLPRLMLEGLLLGGAGLGVLALIFEIAADAFSVAAYQTLLAIYGAGGYHQIAIWAFILLSVLLFLGIVPAYKAGAYLRPNAGGSGPMVEAIGPSWMRWLSWVGTSLFFLDAILTIIISSISASDVTMLVLPEMAPYRIILAESFAFFIMAILVAMGPQRAVPLFLIGGGLFTLFTIVALGIVGVTSVANPDWAFLTEGIVSRLQLTGVVDHVVRVQQDMATLGTVLIFQLFFRSMSSAMLGFSGYEVIPASGKHAARPKWKVISVALTLAAVFLIGTGIVQLFAAQQWKVPATEGYSTLLIEYEIVATQVLGGGVSEEDVIVTPADTAAATEMYVALPAHVAQQELLGEPTELEVTAPPPREEYVSAVSKSIAVSRAINDALTDTFGGTFLIVAGVLLAIILLLAQGGGYVGGAAVAANAARLGRLPAFFTDDRIGIAVIWAISAVLIPIIRQVTVVEAYYAFGFVSAFIITSTAVFFVRKDVLEKRGIDPHSSEAKSLKFAGFRGMIASYLMGIVLITQKTDALLLIATTGAVITLFQIYIARGGFRKGKPKEVSVEPEVITEKKTYDMGIERALDHARQRGTVDAVEHLIESGMLQKFNVGPRRIRRLAYHLYDIDLTLFDIDHGPDGHERIEEPNLELEAAYQQAFGEIDQIARRIEDYSHIGIFMYIRNYHLNWVAPEQGRDEAEVTQTMLDILFPLTPHDEIWREYQAFTPQRFPENIWQFSRQRYQWAKEQWPNLSDRITTIWTLQDFGLIPKELDIRMVISVADGKQYRRVSIHTHMEGDGIDTEKETLDDGDESEGVESFEVDIDANDDA